jgi:hypothetical protein
VDELILTMTARDFALRFYRGMLRLYPPQFRADYADEMQEVFRQALAENENSLLLMHLLLAEIRDLPVSVLREHWRERQTQSVWQYQESSFMKRLYSPRLLRFCAVMILMLCGLYGLSVVSAYFAFDIHIHSLQNSYEWWYDYDNNPAFISRQLPIGLFVLILYLLIIPVMVVFGGALGLNVLGRWRTLAFHERRLTMIAFIAVIFVLLSWFTPLGTIGSLWFYD